MGMKGPTHINTEQWALYCFHSAHTDTHLSNSLHLLSLCSARQSAEKSSALIQLNTDII